MKRVLFTLSLLMLTLLATLAIGGGSCLNNCRSTMNKCKHDCKGDGTCTLGCIYAYQVCVSGCPQ